MSVDPQVISFIAWFLSWRAASWIADGRFLFTSHLLYTIGNIMLLAYNWWLGEWGMVGMFLTFLYTSTKGVVRNIQSMCLEKRAFMTMFHIGT